MSTISKRPWNDQDVENFRRFVALRGGRVAGVVQTNNGNYVFDIVPPRPERVMTGQKGHGPSWSNIVMQDFEERGRLV